MIKVSGEGKLFINTFGAIDKHTLDAGKTLIVNIFHLVSFSNSYNLLVIMMIGEFAMFFVFLCFSVCS